MTCSYMHSSHMILVTSFRGSIKPPEPPLATGLEVNTASGVDSTKTGYPAALTHHLPLLHKSMGRTRGKDSLGESLPGTEARGSGDYIEAPLGNKPHHWSRIIHYDRNLSTVLSHRPLFCNQSSLQEFHGKLAQVIPVNMELERKGLPSVVRKGFLLNPSMWLQPCNWSWTTLI